MVLRIARSAARRPWSAQARPMQHAALAVQHPPPPPPPLVARGRQRPSLPVRKAQTSIGPAIELEKRVKALEEAVAEEEKSLAPLFYSEADLMFLYEDLLKTSPSPSPSAPKLDIEAQEQQRALEDAQVIQGAEWRLSQNHPDIIQHVSGEEPFYHRVVAKAQAVTRRYEEMRGLALKGTDDEGQAVAGPSKVFVPVNVLSLKECEAILRACTRLQDGPGAVLTLDIMKRSAMPISEAAVTSTLEIVAGQGNVTATEAVITNFTTSPTERQRHLHIKAHIKSYLKETPRPAFPTSALAVLRSYEEKGLFAPMKTYTSCIITLLTSPSSASRAQGWDLFTHMRYVAHPNPDVWLYATMIRACAYPLTPSRRSEPEKALDFWTEMTVDKKIKPTVEAYNAVILACAKSGLERYVNEAYRIAKQMLDANRDARGRSAYKPDQRTFNALLEGAKRVRDLERARWILAEVVRGGIVGKANKDLNEPMGVHVDRFIMMSLFNAYCSHRVPFKRELTLVREEAPADESTTTPYSMELPDSAPSFSHIPPQSREEVIHEVTYLFQRILEDVGIRRPPARGQNQSYLENMFSKVEVTAQLLNAYVSVFYRHAPLQVARKLYLSVFEETKIRRTARTYVEALQRCAFGASEEREVALQFADEVWKQWQVLEDDSEAKVEARSIESAYSARIRTYAKYGEVDEALQVLYSFVQRYPPSSVREVADDPLFLSTRTSLADKSRPLVRMTGTTEVPDDMVPPLLMFSDLELLHSRLAFIGMQGGVNYVKWVTKAYEWMLRVRRDETFKKRR